MENSLTGPAFTYGKRGHAMRIARLRLFGALVAITFAAQAAQAQTVKQTFEQYNLIGIFAVDCAAEPSSQNLYHVQRAIDDSRVQGDQMSGTTKRDFAIVFDRVIGARPNELALSGTINGQRYNMVLRVEGARKRTMEMVREPNDKRIAGGRFVSNGQELPWHTNCDAAAQQTQAPADGLPVAAPAAQGGTVQALFERYNLVGHFAWDCSRPPNRESNWYFINRVVDANHAQRDFMTGPTTRGTSIVLDKVVELQPNQLSVGGVGDGQVVEGIWIVEPNRMRQWASTRGGNKQIVNGRWVATGIEMPWLNKCNVPG